MSSCPEGNLNDRANESGIGWDLLLARIIRRGVEKCCLAHSTWHIYASDLIFNVLDVEKSNLLGSLVLFGMHTGGQFDSATIATTTTTT
jgi:hypothetical protein